MIDHTGSSGPRVPGRRRRAVALAGLVALTASVGGLRLGTADAAGAGQASVIVPTDPYRILDTRTGVGTGGVTTPLAAGQVLTLQVAGVGPVPADATGVVINLTVSNGTASGSYITAWPTGTARPDTSVINVVAGQDTANMITANLGGGKLDLYNFSGQVNLIADVAGYLVPAGSGSGGAGPQGPQGLQGPAGPPGPTAASYAQATPGYLITAAPVVVTKLSDPASGGVLTTTFDARLAIDGAVTVGNSANTGEFSVIRCRLQLDHGTGFTDVGPEMYSESIGNSNHDEAYVIAMHAMADRPAGNFDVRIVCYDSHHSAGSVPRARAAAINVIAVAKP